jgi:hypothetical protein
MCSAANEHFFTFDFRASSAETFYFELVGGGRTS